MKKIIKYITEYIRALASALLMLFIWPAMCLDRERNCTGKRNENIVKPQNLNTCGSYPASGIFVDGNLLQSTTAKGCATAITAWSSNRLLHRP